MILNTKLDLLIFFLNFSEVMELSPIEKMLPFIAPIEKETFSEE